MGESMARVARLPNSLLALTLGRLLLVPPIVVSLEAAPGVTALALAVFVAVDLYDGVAARRLGADDVGRRALDSAVDRIAIWSVYGAVALAGLLPFELFSLLLARDLYCAFWCYRIVRERDTVICADWLYRGLNLGLAAWVVVAPLMSAQSRGLLFVGMLAFAVVVAVDLTRSARLVLALPWRSGGSVIPAGELRVRHGELKRRHSRSPLNTAEAS